MISGVRRASWKKPRAATPTRNEEDMMEIGEEELENGFDAACVRDDDASTTQAPQRKPECECCKIDAEIQYNYAPMVMCSD